MPVRPGFIIPAAGTTTANLPSSQPDQGDFVTLGNQRYGVVAGCDLSYIPGGAGQPGTVRIGSGPNLVKVDDTLYTIPTSTEAMVSTTVGVGDRIDLVVYDATRGLSVVTGAPASDPIMPDISTSMTLLFILYVQLVNAKVTVIDKRIFLGRSLISTIGPTTTLVQNRDSAGNPLITMLGNGTIQWGVNDAYLQRTGTNELTLNSKLIVGTVVAESISINGHTPVTSATHYRGTTLPEVGDFFLGDMFTNTSTGAIYVYQTSGWALIPTNSAVPVGTVIQSQLEFEPNKNGVLAGYLPMDGRTIDYADYPVYFAARGVGSGTLTLTDARGCYLTQPTSAAIGTKFGNAQNRVTLLVANLAEHRHELSAQTSAAGAHIPTGSTNPAGGHTPGVSAYGGLHTHIAFDSGHLHPPEWPNDGLGFLTDTPNPHFNVRGGPIGILHPATTLPYPSHNYPGPAGGATDRAYLAVPAETTGVGNANIGVVAEGSAHIHEMHPVPNHAHGIQLDPVGSHSHTVPIHNAVGGNQPIDITPSSLAINYYVKVA